MSMYELLYGTTPEDLILEIDPECREIIDDIEFDIDFSDVENN